MPESERSVPLRQKIWLFVSAVLPTMLLIFAVLGSIFMGIAAVTEAAAVGVIASMVLAACYGQLNFGILKKAGYETLNITSMIMMIAVGASFFSTVFVTLGGDDVIIRLFSSLPFGRWGALLVIMLLLILLGMFIDWMGIIFIVVPLITPIAAELGFDPIWFAVLVMLNLQISFLTPPFAYSIFYLKGITPPDVKTTDIYRGVIPFVGLQILAVLLCILFPQLLTWLPGYLIG
jgi:tripartite ATP-independent transporter DctM subunit